MVHSVASINGTVSKESAEVEYDANVVIGRERVSLRLLVFDAQVLLERELIHADRSTFTHSIWIDNRATLFAYITADPYFMQLERHYNIIQEKLDRILEGRS